MNTTAAYKAGAAAAKNNTNISNCFPYTKGKEYQDWLEGYRSIKPGAEEDELGKALRALTKEYLGGTKDDYLD